MDVKSEEVRGMPEEKTRDLCCAEEHCPYGKERCFMGRTETGPHGGADDREYHLPCKIKHSVLVRATVR